MDCRPDIDNGRAFDWGRVSKDYGRYRDIYPAVFYQRIMERGLCVKGQTVLDLGTGTGVLPRHLAGYGARFTGIDAAANQIAEARRLTGESGLDIRYEVSSAEDMHFPDNSFDVVTACQCFMYFEKAVVLPKIHRMLKEGGHFCILFMAWLPDESIIAKTSEELVLKYNPGWTGGHMQRYTPAAPDEAMGLFDVEDALCYDLPVTFTRESWHGRIKACRGIGASSLSGEEIAAFEREHMAYLDTVPEVFDIPHFATILNLRKKS